MIPALCLLRLVHAAGGAVSMSRLVQMLAVPRADEQVEVVGQRMGEGRCVSEWTARVTGVWHYPATPEGTFPSGQVEVHLASRSDAVSAEELAQEQADLAAAGWEAV